LQTILFTVDDEILELVADNDRTFEVDAMDDESIYSSSDDVINRPSTADNDVSTPNRLTLNLGLKGMSDKVCRLCLPTKSANKNLSSVMQKSTDLVGR